jgi:pyruvate kinase
LVHFVYKIYNSFSSSLALAGNYPLESVNVMHEILQQIKAMDDGVHPKYFVHTAGTGNIQIFIFTVMPQKLHIF